MTVTANQPLAKPSIRSWQEALIIILLALFPILFFWRVFLAKPADRLGIAEGDFTEQYFPLRAFSAQEWVNGHVPLWNPAIFGGQPALADPQSGALYPPHIVQAFIWGWSGLGFPLQALELQMAIHFSLAAVGAYLLGRYWAQRISASQNSVRLMGLVVSITFTYGGYLTSFPVQQMTILAASAWLPWVMLTLSRTFDAIQDDAIARIWLPRVGWASLAFAMAILAGHPQSVMYIFYLSLAYAIFSAWNIRPNAIRILARWLMVISLGVIISAAQLWPTLEFIRHSLRADLSFEAVSRGLPLSELMSVLYPGYFGGSPEYIGILPMVLIAVALVLAPVSLRRTVFFWLGVGFVALLLSFGANTFLYPISYLLVPGFDAVRQQERVFMLYSFAASILAGYGALALSQPMSLATRVTWAQSQRGLYRVSAVALAMTGLYLYGSTAASQRGDEVNLFFGVLRHHVFGLVLLSGSLVLLALRPRFVWRRWWGMLLIVGWIGFNLFTINWQFNLAPRSDPPVFAAVETSQFLVEHTANLPQPVRIASGGLLRGGNNAASVLGLEDVTGNTPLQLASVTAFAEQMPSWRFWQLMNVRYVLDARDIDGPGLARRYEAEGIKTYEVGDPFPRARVVHQVIASDNLAILAQDATDLKTTALVPARVSLPPPPTTITRPSSAVIQETHPGWLSIEVDAAADGLLVVSNIDYPGWHAQIDGETTEHYQTNGIFQGIFVPAGQHTITLRFWPDSFRWGVWVSVVGILVALGLIVSGYRKWKIINS